jgi:hypothetical protein
MTLEEENTMFFQTSGTTLPMTWHDIPKDLNHPFSYLSYVLCNSSWTYLIWLCNWHTQQEYFYCTFLTTALLLCDVNSYTVLAAALNYLNLQKLFTKCHMNITGKEKCTIHCQWRTTAASIISTIIMLSFTEIPTVTTDDNASCTACIKKQHLIKKKMTFSPHI